MAEPTRSDDEAVLGELDVSPGQGPAGALRLAPGTGSATGIDEGSTDIATLHLDLEPGTDHEVLVATTDSEGHTSYATGSFTTLRRHADVTFSDAELVSIPSTAAVLAYMRVDGTWMQPGAPIAYDGSHVSIDVPPIDLADVDRKLDVFVQLAQAGGGDGKVCGASGLPADGPGGTVGCFTYNSTAGPPIGPPGSRSSARTP